MCVGAGDLIKKKPFSDNFLLYKGSMCRKKRGEREITTVTVRKFLNSVRGARILRISKCTVLVMRLLSPVMSYLNLQGDDEVLSSARLPDTCAVVSPVIVLSRRPEAQNDSTQAFNSDYLSWI